MAQMLVRNIRDDVAERFKARARAEGKSAEQLLRELITKYSRPEPEAFWAEADRIRASTRGQPPLDVVGMIREDRDGDHGRSR